MAWRLERYRILTAGNLTATLYDHDVVRLSKEGQPYLALAMWSTADQTLLLTDDFDLDGLPDELLTELDAALIAAGAPTSPRG